LEAQVKQGSIDRPVHRASQALTLLVALGSEEQKRKVQFDVGTIFAALAPKEYTIGGAC